MAPPHRAVNYRNAEHHVILYHAREHRVTEHLDMPYHAREHRVTEHLDHPHRIHYYPKPIRGTITNTTQ